MAEPARAADDVDADAVEHALVRRRVGPGHDPRHAELLAEQRHEEVLLVAVRHGDEHAALGRALVLEEVDVGPVALEDEGRRQQLRQFLAPDGIRLDELQLEAARRLEALRHHLPDRAAPDDHQVAAVDVVAAREARGEAAHAPAVAHAEHAVAGLDAGVAARQEHLPGASHAHEHDPVGHPGLAHGLAGHGRRALHRVLEQLDAAVLEKLDVECARRLDDADDLAGQPLLRPDHDIDAERQREGPLAPLEGEQPVAPVEEADGAGGAEALGRHAPDEVALVLEGAGDERVGLPDAGLAEGLRRRHGPVEGLDVEPLEARGGDVVADEQHHLVRGHERLGEPQCDVVVATDHDPHPRMVPRANASPPRWAGCQVTSHVATSGNPRARAYDRTCSTYNSARSCAQTVTTAVPR